jgi:hypothetical protein
MRILGSMARASFLSRVLIPVSNKSRIAISSYISPTKFSKFWRCSVGLKAIGNELEEKIICN